MPHIIPADTRHAASLVPALREPDKAELAAHDKTPIDGLLESLEVSGDTSWCVHHDGEVLALFGAAHCTDDLATPWLLGSDALITTHRRWFIRHSRQIIEAADHRFRRYFNYADARNTAHLRWIKWVGYMVLDPVPWGPHRLPFHPFYRKVKTNV